MGGQDRRDADLRVIELVDQLVVAFDRRPVASRHTRERLAGHRGQRTRAVHESLAQAPIPQRCTAKLLLRPALALQALGQPQGTRNDRFDTAQALSEIRLQRIHIDGFDALGMTVLTVLATASLGLADLDPVGRLIAGAHKPVGLHEALNEPGTIPVLSFEIQINTPQHPPQHAGGQIMTAHRGADQKAAQAHDTVQLLAPCLGIPTDPLVSIG